MCGCGDIPLLVLKWRVVFLWAVRGIVSLQKAHLREHSYQSKEEDQAWGIVPHYGFLALGATRDALLHAPGTSIQQAPCNLQVAGS